MPKSAAVLILLGAAVACSADAPPAPAAPVETVSGALSLVDGALHFTSCGATTATPIAGRNGEAAQLLAEFAPADGRITAVITRRADSLVEIRYAGLEGPSCETLPPDGVFVASGTEPFWHLRIVGDTATVSSPEALDGEAYAGGTWDSPTTFHAVGASGDTLRAAFEEARCADGMSGARFPWRATISWHGRSMDGCAIDGKARRVARVP